MFGNYFTVPVANLVTAFCVIQLFGLEYIKISLYVLFVWHTQLLLVQQKYQIQDVVVTFCILSHVEAGNFFMVGKGNFLMVGW